MPNEKDKLLKIFNKYATANVKSIGIGMGSTMLKFSEILPSKYLYFPASNQTLMFLKNKTVSSLQNASTMDLYFDGADYYDCFGNLIKGGGGALTVEKLMINMSKKSVIVVQNNKYVNSFEELAIPVEILKESYGYFLRVLKDHSVQVNYDSWIISVPFLTDNGNYIVDVNFDYDFIQDCKRFSGVIEHGYVSNNLKFEIEEI
ncbi:ribose 5-phosphate isomerase A [Vittaforma corneae ATCC 50505]|uniref:Ribose-5-phosphate isomerase n=1 Tax=Vittaforma corneae (strain ATCC 50505) TaxID=993615 RepID=L2GL96_VITCO|nr:ribose 5-phosphate isomerase A [Vittaforma corneae ATCC 50505]ELA41643.1 ribose 5-phosphate isomerase A [Vittaforma corneae ATCC 50505]